MGDCKHTPGPWEVRVSKVTKEARVAPEVFARFGRLGNEAVVARTYAWGDQRAPRTAEEKWVEMVHNAYLVQAAPNLLAASELALDFIRRKHGNTGEARVLLKVLTEAIGRSVPEEIP